VRITLVRHATLVVEIAGRLLLVDPMLDDAGTRKTFFNAPDAVFRGSLQITGLLVFRVFG